MFYKKWMNNINPDLLLRYWRIKGSPGILIIKRGHGLWFEYRNYYGIEIKSIVHPVFLNS